jgi:O-antigen/teichoic acid export membrane protein
VTSTLLRNAAATAFQFFSNAVILFLLYRYLTLTLGVAQVGLWSLVLASVTLAVMGQSGLESTVTKFVAQYIARKELGKASEVVQTAILLSAVLTTTLLSIAFVAGFYGLPLLIPEDAVPEARALLPYAITAGWLSLLGTVLQSSLAGLQVIALPRLWMLACAAAFLLLSVLLVPDHGLMGVAYAQIVQTGAAALGCMILLRRNLPGLPLLPRKWSNDAFREIVGYGLKVQVTSFSDMLLDVIVKALIAKVGGLAIVGYYDIAARMGLLIRGVVVIAAQALVPFVADLFERNISVLTRYYQMAVTTIVIISWVIFGLFISLLTTVSFLFFAEDVFMFRVICMVVCFGWFGNTLASAAMYFYMGEGELRWFTWSGIIGLGVYCVLGTACALLLGAEAAIGMWAITKWLSALIIIITYHRSRRLAYVAPFLRENGGVLLAGLAGVLLALASITLHQDPLPAAPIYAACFLAPVSLALWTHPLRPQLTATLAQWRRAQAQGRAEG